MAGMGVWFGLLAGSLLAGETVRHPIRPVPIQQVTVEDDFWSPKRKVWQQVTIVDVLAKLEKDGAMENFDRVRDGLKGGHKACPWHDGLLYETIRGVADFLAAERNPEIEKRIDRYIEHIAAAQAMDPDGYLNTSTQLSEPNHRWGMNGGNDHMQHDLYNAGALVEAAVHYYQATGKTSLLRVAARLVNYEADVMGPPPKNNVVPGHPLPEEAVIKMYLLFRAHPELKKEMPFAVDETRYLKLAEFWIENRGNARGRTLIGFVAQDDKPLLQQKTIEGHAVRATLLCAGLAAAGTINGRDDYLQTASRLWDNMVQRRMYITGGVGVVPEYEGFVADYTLPNNGYEETCAAIGSAFFHRNMNLVLADAKYVDELERVLYNGALCGVSLKGDTYTYVNPLEFGRGHGRWPWHGCPCCPPMFLKFMGAMPGYIFAQDDAGLYVNLFVGSRAKVWLGGTRVALRQKTRYPWQGAVQIAVDPERAAEFDLRIRIPAWCRTTRSPNDLYQATSAPIASAVTIKLNGKAVEPPQIVRGYAVLHRTWKPGDQVELTMPMPVRRIKAHPAVKADIGRVALMRGPIVYCAESIDNKGGVRNLFLSADASLSSDYRADLLGGVAVVQGEAKALYRDAPQVRPARLLAIPYYAYANRGPVEMTVWLADSKALAVATTLAGQASPSASHCFPSDSLAALNNQAEAKKSDDESIPRFTWWDHRGSKEWVQYDFDKPARVSAVAVYWFDERRLRRHCRVPQSWRLLYKDVDQWKPVANLSAYGIAMDCYNRVTFDPIKTSALRIEVQLQSNWSGGILQWKVE
jgi:DUF1680 family protein